MLCISNIIFSQVKVTTATVGELEAVKVALVAQLSQSNQALAESQQRCEFLEATLNESQVIFFLK